MPATAAGTSETIRARSRFLPFSEPLPVPRRLMSQKIPEARKPRGATMEPVIRANFVFINMQTVYWERSETATGGRCNESCGRTVFVCVDFFLRLSLAIPVENRQVTPVC